MKDATTKAPTGTAVTGTRVYNNRINIPADLGINNSDVQEEIMKIDESNDDEIGTPNLNKNEPNGKNCNINSNSNMEYNDNDPNNRDHRSENTILYKDSCE